MATSLLLHPDRLFPPDPAIRRIARRLYESVADLPIISPHGHCDPSWFAQDCPFADPHALLVAPDHYLTRMLYSQGVPLERLGISPVPGADLAEPVETDARAAWATFAAHYHLFRGTPSAIWLNHVFVELFGLEERLSVKTADHHFDIIADALKRPDFRPRALFERFRIEVLATTDAATDKLEHHDAIARSGWSGRVIPTFRPDGVVDPETPAFRDNLNLLSALTGRDCRRYPEYLAALRDRRAVFKAQGATATDHGHPSAATADLGRDEAERLFGNIVSGQAPPHQAELFRAHMLTVMAEMSLDDGLVMQLHPGSLRNHNAPLFARFGSDRGADIPTSIEYARALRPLLNLYGNEPGLTLILFTLDESNYARELAPLAGHYPALRLGPAWWFHDSPEGMRRYRRRVTETAGFANTAGFNDDTRAFLSIPARHDMARRIDCGFLAELVAEHRLALDEAEELSIDLCGGLARRAYRL